MKCSRLFVLKCSLGPMYNACFIYSTMLDCTMTVHMGQYHGSVVWYRRLTDHCITHDSYTRPVTSRNLEDADRDVTDLETVLITCVLARRNGFQATIVTPIMWTCETSLVRWPSQNSDQMMRIVAGLEDLYRDEGDISFPFFLMWSYITLTSHQWWLVNL